MTTFDQPHRQPTGAPPMPPYLPDLGFTDNDWIWEGETDDTDDMEPDDDTPGIAVAMVAVIGFMALVALVLGVALLLAPLITVR
jgi:hypothetical protein